MLAMPQLNETTILNVLDAENGKYSEQVLRQPEGLVARRVPEKMIPYPRSFNGRMTVDPEQALFGAQARKEAMTTAQFADYLRQGIMFDAFTSYNETPTIWQMIAGGETPSNKQKEEYVKDAALGALPVVPEGKDYPEANVDTNDGVVITNHKYGYIISVTEEMQRFDQVGKVRELGELQGRAARLTEELAVMDVITTTGNYTRTNTAGDNDESATGSGANQQTLTFGAVNLIIAFNILATMKDRKTGVKLGVMPNMLVVAPKLLSAAKMLIQSPSLLRVAAAASAEQYGTGMTNPFFGIVDTVVSSPYFGSGYEWWLGQAGRAVKFQRVEPFTIMTEGDNAGANFNRSVKRFRIRNWFGVGMRDDRFAFFSNSTTAPAAT